MIIFNARGRAACCEVTEPITTGSVGMPVEFRFDDAWDGLSKTAIFTGSGVSVDQVIGADNALVVPWECLADEGGTLIIGVTGTRNSGEIVIPTVLARAGVILKGAALSGVDPHDPTPSWAVQVQEEASEALVKATAVEEAAARGDFDGEDGVSPTVTVTDITGGHRVSITDATSTQTVDVMDGTDGQDGADGQDGVDGVSPEVTVTAITGGHTVSITDADHPSGQSFNVMDGVDGTDGVGVPSGGTTGQVLKKASGTDYDTEWADPSAATPEQMRATTIYETVTGSVASFPDGADGVPLKSVLCYINPLQSGTGDPSPDNRRLITGFTGLTLTRSGVNSADEYTAEVSWEDSAGTIYGGTYNFITGVLSKKWARDKIRNIINTYRNGVFHSYWAAPVRYKGMCEIYETTTKEAPMLMANNSVCFGSHYWDSRNRVAIKDTRYTTLASFFAAVGDEYLYYELATPVTYQLNPAVVLSLLGQNTVSHNCNGNTTCEYTANTKLYIDRLTAPDEDMIADGLIASGKYFAVNNQLYLSTAQIAAGAQIIPGSNCTATNIAEALNALNA